MELTGIHHLTPVTGDAPRNRSFYTQTLGLRLVKKTVNQDDTSVPISFTLMARALPAPT